MKDWGDFRKLYTQLPPAFERLPFRVRCMSAEIIRRCDRKGRIVPCDASASRDAVIEDLSFHVRAHSSDAEFIRIGVDALMADGYLVVSGGWLTIRNFKDAQETDSAKRMRAKRSRDASYACDAQNGSDEQEEDPSPGLVSSGLITDTDLHDRSDRHKPRDPLAYLTGGAPYQRQDVGELFGLFCKTFGFTGRKLDAPNARLDAETLADAIDAYGLDDCKRVCIRSRIDRMVTGEADDHGVRHDSIKYIFGNADSFARILRDAREAGPERKRGSIREVIAAAKALESE